MSKKKKIKYIILLFFWGVYFAIYYNQYDKAVKPDIRYFDKGTVIENFGMSYDVSGKIYSKDELIKEYGIAEYMFGESSNEYEKKYIIVTEIIKKYSDKIIDEPNDIRNMTIYSKFWQVGYEVDLTEELHRSAEKSTYELKAGESIVEYRVFSIASCNLSKKLWENVEKTTVWYEFTDTETCPYVRRIRIIN